VIRTLFLLLFFLVPSFVYERTASEEGTFLPNGNPAQFAASICKRERFYERHGIDLTSFRAPASPSSAFLAEGKADFVTMLLSNAVRMRSGGHRSLTWTDYAALRLNARG